MSIIDSLTQLESLISLLLIFLAVLGFLWKKILSRSEGAADTSNPLTESFSSKGTEIITPEIQRVLDLVEHGHQGLFLTGKAGTGKSTVVNMITKKIKKRFVKVAPTGVAALNIGGQTIHSFFKFDIDLDKIDHDKIDYNRVPLFQSIDAMIVDEVSMLNPSLLEQMDIRLRMFRHKDIPFGGVQMIFVGDLFQIPPVIIDDRVYKAILSKYGGIYFYNYLNKLKDYKYDRIELSKVFRQKDPEIIEILNEIRKGQPNFSTLSQLALRVKPLMVENKNQAVILASRRTMVREYNKKELDLLKTKTGRFEARVIKCNKRLNDLVSRYKAGTINEDDFDKNWNYSFPFMLEIKIGCRVMFTNNADKWVNGSIGIVKEFTENSITVDLPGTGVLEVMRLKIEEVEFIKDNVSDRIIQNVINSVEQFPLQLAYAMTIHKSQGKTFDNVHVHVDKTEFVSGLYYVALSRCRSLEGITLSSAINKEYLVPNKDVIKFYNEIEPITLSEESKS